VNTLFTKILSAVFSLAIVMLTTHVFGPEGRGEISLISADLTIVLLFSQILGGSSLVYLYSRESPFLLLLSAIVWAIISPLIVLPIMNALGWIEHDYFIHLIFLSLLMGVSSCFQVLVLGAEKIMAYNVLNLMITLIAFFSLAAFFFIFQCTTPFYYVISLYISYSISLMAGAVASQHLLKETSFKGIGQTVKRAFQRGATVQFSNIVQFFNYRLSLFFLNQHMASLGIFSISLVLAEAVWLIGNSISLVHFSHVSNEKNKDHSQRQAFLFAKISFWATLACVLILALSPSYVYSFVFGVRFGAVKLATLALCPGILAIGFGMVFSHYFAGTGRFKINNMAAVFGLIVKIPACLFLIPRYLEVGAGLACSISYMASFIFLYVCFKRETGFGLKDLNIHPQELREIVSFAKKPFL
jgi:O-antigen/teichoic acid export membrane protein